MCSSDLWNWRKRSCGVSLVVVWRPGEWCGGQWKAQRAVGAAHVERVYGARGRPVNGGWGSRGEEREEGRALMVGFST